MSIMSLSLHQKLSGAKVLKINGDDPFVAVDANALITGSFQGFGTRQNSYVLRISWFEAVLTRQD